MKAKSADRDIKSMGAKDFSEVKEDEIIVEESPDNQLVPPSTVRYINDDPNSEK